MVVELVHRVADAEDLVDVGRLLRIYEIALGGVVSELENLVAAVRHVEGGAPLEVVRADVLGVEFNLDTVVQH